MGFNDEFTQNTNQHIKLRIDIGLPLIDSSINLNTNNRKPIHVIMAV